MRRLLTFVTLALLTSPGGAARADKIPVKTLRTPAGVTFGLVGEKGAAPAPTLLVFANDYGTTLTSPDFNKVGHLLAKQGFLAVALDLPCHGKNTKPGEPAGIDGWSHRLKQGEEFVPEHAAKVRAVLDYLVAEGYTDPKRVAAVGTSRGGFMALHVAAAEPRIAGVVAFAPVTELAALREFAGMEKHPATRALDAGLLADRLAGRGLWLCIGNNDTRVNTDAAVAVTRKVVAASVAAGKPPRVELRVTATDGHRIHKTAHDEAAAWLAEFFGPAGK